MLKQSAAKNFGRKIFHAMDIRLRTGNPYSHSLCNIIPIKKKILHPCSAKGSPPQNPNDDADDNSKGDRLSTDWDKAWSSFRKRGKKNFFSDFSNKYVSWNPRRSEFPSSEEVDPIKRSERSNLMLWTSPRFTLTLAIVIVSLLLVYTLLVPTK